MITHLEPDILECEVKWALRVKLSHSVMSNSLQPHELYSRLLCPWYSPGRNTGVGCHLLLQQIFPTQGLNPGLLHFRWFLYQLNNQGRQWALGSTDRNKASGDDGIQLSNLKSQNMMLLKCCTQYVKFGKLSKEHRTGESVFIQPQRRTIPKNVQTTIKLCSLHMLAR